MSKSLRTILLSVLITVLAASSALANISLTFKWVGTNGNYWGHASNWLPLSGDVSTDYSAVKDKIVAFKDGIEFYPGSFTASSDQCSVDVRVVISKDATISMTQGGAAGISVGSLVGIKSIDIIGTSSTKTAKVVLDMGADSWFEDTPAITVQNQFSSLRINGTHTPAFKITKATTWQSTSADLLLYMPVSFVSDAADLSLNVSNAALYIGNSTLLGSTAARKTHITMDQDAESPAAKFVARLVFDVEATSTGAALDIMLNGYAKRIDTLKNVTLGVWSVDVRQAVSMDSQKTFTKGGAATLTLNKAANAYGRKGIPVINTNKFSVIAGTLAVSGAGYAPLVRYTAGKVTFTVENASLDLGTRSISADAGVSVDLVVKSGGKVFFHTAAVDVADVYSGGELALNSDVSADVSSGGVLHFYGSQALAHIRGAGTIESEAADSMLILKGDSDDIKDFTGTIRSLDVGIVQNWPIVPFLTKATGSINTLYVFGENGALTLDSKKLADIEGLEETNVYLRSSIPGSTTDAQLRNIKVGQLNISGDISLNVVSVDGTKDANGVGAVNFDSENSSLTVNKLVIHANADKDFNATKAGTSNVYVNVRAIDIYGPGTFIPKAIVNGAGSSVKVGNEDSIVVEEGATLKLNGVEFPAYNSLLLKSSSIDVDNDTRIHGNLIIGGKSRIKVALTADNARTFETSKDIESAAIVIDGIFKLSEDATISVDILDLNDPARFLGEMYSVVGYPSFDIGARAVTSVDVDLIGDYAVNKSIQLGLDKNGMYAQLVKWSIKPYVRDWEWVAGDSTTEFGMANKQFEARISYGLSDDISPDITDLLRPRIYLYHNGVQARKVSSATGDVTATYLTPQDARQNMATPAGDRLAFLEVSQDVKNHYIYLSGTSYLTSLDVRITLSWDLSSSSVSRIKQARITPKVSVGGNLTSDHAHNGPVKPEDLVNLEEEKRPLANPARADVPTPTPKRSDDIYITPTVEVTSTTTVFDAGSDAVFEFTIQGMATAPATNSVPVFMNGVYMWFDGISSSDRYVINGETVTDLQVLVNGTPIDMASVDIIPEGNNVRVVIPVALLGSASGNVPEGKTITIIAKAVDDDATIHIDNIATVTINPVYTEGTVHEGQKSVTFMAGRIPTSDQQLAEYPMTDPVSYDVTGDVPEGIIWNISGGVIAYRLAPNTPEGTYNMSVRVYNAEGAYKYDFTVTVAGGFRVAYDELYDTYEGWNYEAHFTTANAPAGTVAWTFSSDVNWLHTANSGDMLIVFGQLPPYDMNKDEEADEYNYTVTATVGAETATQNMTITVDEDTTDPAELHSGAFSSTAVGTITHNNNNNLFSVNSNYVVTIALGADYYGEIDFQIPYWLVAAPVLGGEDNDEVVGYTISVRPGTTFASDEGGIVRFDDPESGIVQWGVTFIATTPEPLAITASQTAFNLAAGATATVTMSANVDGVTYTSDKAWAAVSGNTVTITAPAANDSVTITGTDAAGRTATATITVTVTAPAPGPDIEALAITATPATLSFTEGDNLAQSVTMSANVEGVTYTSNKEWAVVDGSTVMVTNPDKSDTITITGTDAAGRTATATITVTVSGGSQPIHSDDVTKFSISASQSTVRVATEGVATVTLSANNATGSVSYTANQEWVLISGNEAMIVAPAVLETTSYTVTFTGTDEGGNAATTTVTVTVVVEEAHATVGSSGGGCDAGFGALALVLAAPLFLRRRRS